MNTAKIEKYIGYFQAKLTTVLKQKSFSHGDYSLKYILEEYDSPDLIIVFSACTRVGIKARYNYGRTLRDVQANKLFILDDFGYDRRGAYYLGHNGDFAIQEGVERLIGRVTGNLGIQRSFFVGSSKGGFAALYFGLQVPDSRIIVGAPQYHLGTYLNRDSTGRTMDYIMGDRSAQSVRVLDEALLKRLNSGRASGAGVYLHASTQDPTYESHVADLIADLSRNGYVVEVDTAEYSDHLDVGVHFAEYLRVTLRAIL